MFLVLDKTSYSQLNMALPGFSGSSAFLVLSNKMLLVKMGLPERRRAFTAVANIFQKEILSLLFCIRFVFVQYHC